MGGQAPAPKRPSTSTSPAKPVSWSFVGAKQLQHTARRHQARVFTLAPFKITVISPGMSPGGILPRARKGTVRKALKVSALNHSRQRFTTKLKGEQVSWGLFSKGPSSKETTGILAAGGFMKICHTSAVPVKRLIKWFNSFEVSFLQHLGKRLPLPHNCY